MNSPALNLSAFPQHRSPPHERHTSHLQERLLSSNAKVVIIDPLDVWWGLRVSANGKDQAFPVAIFGGEHGDLPITESAGALLGETVATAQQSCIVSLGGLQTKAAERRFMLAFLEKLYRKAPGEPFHLVFDEADLWAPQKSSEPQIQNLMEQIVRRGRVRGFIPWLITQRPAVISKDVLSQVDGLIAMKLTSSTDRDALGSWIEGQADRADEKRMRAQMATLQRGQGIIWIPARGVLELATFPGKSTFDSSSTPKRGETRRSAVLKPIDLGRLKERLSSLERKPDEPRAAPANVERMLKEAEDRGRKRGDEEGFARGYQKAQADAAAAVGALEPTAQGLVVSARQFAVTQRVAEGDRWKDGGMDLPTGEKACLIATAQHPSGVRREQLTVLTGYKRSSRDAYIQRLRTKGYIRQDGSRIIATPSGITALGSSYDPLPTGAALRERVLRELPEGERKTLMELIGRYPRSVSMADLDKALGYKRSSRDAYIQRLRVRELVTTDGDGVRASDNLFDKGSHGQKYRAAGVRDRRDQCRSHRLWPI